MNAQEYEVKEMENYIRELRHCLRELLVNSQDGIRDHDLEIKAVELAEKPIRKE